MSQKLQEITGDHIQSGIFPALEHSAAPLWQSGQNVMFSERSVSPMPGQYVLIPAAVEEPVRGIVETNISGEPNIFYGTTSKAFRWSQGDGSIELGTGFNADYWTGFRWGSWTVLTPWPNGVVQLWKSDVDFDDLDGRDSQFETARASLAYKRFAIFFGLDTDGKKIIWSDADNVEDYVGTLANAAGSLTVPEAESDILAAVVFNEEIYFATSASLYKLKFIGYPNFFDYVPVVKGAGVFGPWSLCVGGDNYLYGFGPTGFWRTDGQSMMPVDIPAVRKEVANTFNRLQGEKVVVYHDMQSKHVFFNYPTDGDENAVAKAWNYVDRNWAPSSQARTCASDLGILSTPLLGDSLGNIWAQLITGVIAGQADPSITPHSIGVINTPYGRGAYGRGSYGGYHQVEQS